MKTSTIKNSIALFFTLGSFVVVNAQESSVSAGGEATGTGGTASYSVGQVVYTANSSAGGSVSQGVQQTYTVVVESGIEVDGIALECTAYPNPTTDFLTLQVKDFESVSLSIQLYDMSSKLILSKKVESNETNIEMGNLVPETYYLKVTQNSKEVKTFKIVKN